MAAASAAARSAWMSASTTCASGRREPPGDAQAEALRGAGHERHLPGEGSRRPSEGGGTAAVGLHLPGLDEAALGGAEGAHPAEGIGRLCDPQAVEVDVARRVRLLPGVARGEDAETGHDRDDGRRPVRRDVRPERLGQEARHLACGNVVRRVEEEGRAARVDDLVGRHGSADDGGLAGRRLEVLGRDRGRVEGHDLEGSIGREEAAQRRRDDLQQAVGGLVRGQPAGCPTAATDDDAAAPELGADGAHDVRTALRHLLGRCRPRR